MFHLCLFSTFSTSSHLLLWLQHSNCCGINMVQLHHTSTPQMKRVVSKEENYSCTSVIHLYSNHYQFTVDCNTPASTHTHKTKCPNCHSTQTELTFQINTTLFMNPCLGDVKCAVHMVDNTKSWPGELDPHFHGHRTVTTKLILLSNTKQSKGQHHIFNTF